MYLPPAAGGIVSHGKILIDRLAGCFCRQALFALDPLLSIEIRIDQAGVDRKAFRTDQTLMDTALQNRLKQPRQQITVAEAPCRFLEKVE